MLLTIRSCWQLLVAITLTALAPLSGTAQVVRGIVVEAATGAAVSGAIVTLVTADGRIAAEGLTTDSGNFALRASAPGLYSVDVKRIGVKRMSSPAVSLKPGETTTMRLTISPAAVSLPDVRVRTLKTCGVPVTEGHNLADLWEDTRAALTATRLTLGQHHFSASAVRYTRQLDPGSLRVRNEQRSEQFGIITQPFSSVPSDELIRDGYVVTEPDGMMTYRAPDADVLLSDSFLATHCFRVQKGKGVKSDLVGLSFEPIPERDISDVTGTLWLDRETHHLRSLDFRYTHQPKEARNDKLGGHLEFTRLPTGAWIIQRWWLRMPLFGTSVRPELSGLPSLTTRVLLAIQEEGGEIITATTADTASKARNPRER